MDSEKLAEEMGVCGFAKKDSLHPAGYQCPKILTPEEFLEVYDVH